MATYFLQNYLLVLCIELLLDFLLNLYYGYIHRERSCVVEPHLNVGAMSHNCRTADHLLWLKTILALGFRRARAPRRRGLVDMTPVATRNSEIWSRNEQLLIALN